MHRHLLFLLSFLLPLLAAATHNRAGEIIVRSAGCDNRDLERTACATIITYTETEQTDVDRDSLELNWGDGTSDVIGRTQIIPLGNGIQRNEYTACHSYRAIGTYTLSFQDVNRVRNVRNIGARSVNIPFSVFTTYTLTGITRNGCNNTPVLTQDPIDNACIGSVWTHSPGAFDVDGDSLAFEFTVPARAPKVPIETYVLPNRITGAAGDLSIDPRTGQITWATPSIPGEYNLAFMVKSFRDGTPLDTVVRDMQIFVDECSNDPPTVDLVRDEICVVAGELIEFDVIAGAPETDTDQRVQLEASGRLFMLGERSATFTPAINGPQPDPLRRRFRWQTSCDDISDQEYFVVFKATDTGPPQPTGLATLRTVSIKVVAPPPDDVQAVASDDDAITVSWESPYACEGADSLDFLGFTVWRREGSNAFAPDTCQTGLAGRGYVRLTRDEIMDMRDGRFVFDDTDVERGRTYCYRVLAIMGVTEPNTGLTLARIESIPSREVCVQLARDIPLLTKVDVVETSGDEGVVDVCWVLPLPESLDTLQNPGPYRYVLSRAPGQTEEATAFSQIATFETPFFGQAVDTCYTDTGLDTEGSAYSYRIELFSGDDSEPVGEGQPASSVRLGGDPTDGAVALSWTELVPWTNTEYEVFRRDPGATDFTLVATVGEMEYLDEGLVNGEEYCYYVRAVGSYNIENIPSPLLNRSQVACFVARDNVAPCAPTLAVESVCDRDVDCTVEAELFNLLIWESPATVCGDEDVAGYRIYYTPDSAGESVLVAEVQGDNLREFRHTPPNGVVGCYTITAFDANDNESETSNRVCVTNCPIYELPNAFTPNGDGQHDLLVPRALCFIERVELEIYNRWGQVVFRTEDPAVNWDGTNLNGEQLPSGTYFYKVRLFERRLQGVVPGETPLSGYIEMFTGDEP